MTHHHPRQGARVRVTAQRYLGRTGTVAGRVRVDAGGHGKTRDAILVDLDKTERAQARQVRVWPSSIEEDR